MADSRRAEEVAGFRIVQAVRLGKEHAGGRPPAAPSPAPPPREPVEPVADRKMRIGKTALPTKHEITCYACGYVFPIAGRVRALICPKCRLTLDQNDYTIDAESREGIRTTGTIRLAAGAVLKEGELIAQTIVLEGRLDGGTVRAIGLLDVGGTQVLGERQFKARDLRVAADASVQLVEPGAFRHLDLHGTLRARLEIAGRATIHPGGNLVGHLTGRHLVVEDGGGLNAAVEIRSASDPGG